MATLRHLPASGFRRSPWKNGGGETIEIAAFPEGASFDAFHWRVSMATVSTSGPFSVFPGIDRTLSVLSGETITLAFEGRASVPLDRASAPYSFPADLAVSGEVAGAGITDLNVMSRRGVARHHVSPMRLEGATAIALAGTALMVLSLEAGLSIHAGAEQLDLAKGDAALITGPDGSLTLKVARLAEIFLIDLWT